MSDLREAAERIRRLDSGDDSTKIYAFAINQNLQMNADFCDLARAYLDEHPADSDEPITEEWLREMGFIYEDLQGECPYDWFKHPSGLIVWDFNGLHWIVNQFDQGGIKCKDFTTRGQLRKLLSVLGIRKETT